MRVFVCCVNDCQNKSLKGWESRSVGEGLLCKQDDMGLFPRDCIKKLSTAACAMYRLCMYTITLVLGRKKQEGPWGLLAETGLAETGCTSNNRRGGWAGKWLSLVKEPAAKAWQPEFDPWNPYKGGRREPPPQRGPLTSTVLYGMTAPPTTHQ